MPLTATWLGRQDIERIADVRLRCYGVPAEREKMLQRTLNDRFDDGDVLMLSQDGVDIATATSLRLNINIRGTVLPCQGVAWVGTARTHRRRRIDGHGLATHVLTALRQKAIERGEPVSMLAPFRVSFYEHFGYGVVEQQATWTIPLGLLPDGNTSGFEDATLLPLPLREGVGGGVTGPVPIQAPDDSAQSTRPGTAEPPALTSPSGGEGHGLAASRHRQFLATHGDVATNERSLQYWLTELKDVGFRFVDRDSAGVVRSQFTLGTEVSGHQTIAVVHRPWWDSPAALRDLLALLGTLKDQYSAARITLPADLPINWLLRERQLPHRPVQHPTAACTLATRMQAAIVGPTRFCAALRPPAGVEGDCRLAIRLRDALQTWRLQFSGGRVVAEPAAGTVDVELDDTVFAAIAFGELCGSDAAALQQICVKTPAALPLLESLSVGPRPYCHEYF